MQGTKLSTVERSMKDHPGPTPGKDEGSTWKEGTQIQGGNVNLEACPRDRTGAGAGGGGGGGIRGSLLVGEGLGLRPSFPGANGGLDWAGGAERWPCG